MITLMHLSIHGPSDIFSKLFHDCLEWWRHIQKTTGPDNRVCWELISADQRAVTPPIRLAIETFQ